MKFSKKVKREYQILEGALAFSNVAILIYHNVSSESLPWLLGAVKLDDFEREIAYLCKVTRIVPLDWLVEQISKGDESKIEVMMGKFWAVLDG